jgi:4-hydroxyphenylpyruvate dioxygenase-like putative hemolysin
MKISLNFPRHGDKENSAFFEDYLVKLLEERDRVGLTQMIAEIDSIMLTVDPGQSINYIAELCLMSPYHYLVTLESESHWTHILRVDMNSPDILLREVKDPNMRGIFRSLNEVYPIGAQKPNCRYMGEILRVNNLHEVVELQSSREFRFFNQNEIRKLELPGNIAITKPSPYTHNIIGYLERTEEQLRVYSLGISEIRQDVQDVYMAAKEIQKKLEIDNLIQPIDHLATRVYSQNREVAILEYLSLSSYYYWGSYDIKDQNSSTNVTKSVHFNAESKSPAKVFTANNTPYFVNHLEKLPSPTENFVRNYGPRLHHIAFSVSDGETHNMTNIDYVVQAIEKQGKDFLLDVIGSKEEGLKQIFSSASEHSSLIIEYVQRFGDFNGFFAKDNVAELTRVAGIDEELISLHESSTTTH